MCHSPFFDDSFQHVKRSNATINSRSGRLNFDKISIWYSKGGENEIGGYGEYQNTLSHKDIKRVYIVSRTLFLSEGSETNGIPLHDFSRRYRNSAYTGI